MCHVIVCMLILITRVIRRIVLIRYLSAVKCRNTISPLPPDSIKNDHSCYTLYLPADADQPWHGMEAGARGHGSFLHQQGGGPSHTGSGGKNRAQDV